MLDGLTFYLWFHHLISPSQQEYSRPARRVKEKGSISKNKGSRVEGSLVLLEK